MATGVQVAWSVTPASNDTADTAIGLREGWAPSTVNDGIRSMMAIIKKWVKDWQGGLVTGGSSTAFTLTTNETLTPLADGFSVVCRMHTTSGAAPTLNVDSTGAVAIQSAVGTAVATGVLVQGGVYSFTYYAAGPAWIVKGLFGGVSRPFAAGTKQLFFQTSAPTGWTKDTSLNNAAIRLVSGSVGADAGTMDFTTAFADRTIARANLPVVTLESNVSHIKTASISFTTTTVPTGAGAGFARSDLVLNKTEGIVETPLGGSGTALSFAVKYADAIRATID